MASSVSLGPAWLMDGPTYNGLILRQSDVSALAYNAGSAGSLITLGGVMQGATRMKVAAGSGMHVTVDGGAAVIPSGVSSVQGAYRIASMSQVTLDVATSDPTNPRIDLVVAWADDLGTSGSLAFLEMVTGTPAASPSPPAAPTSSIILAQVLVPAGSTSVTSGNITDERVFTVAPGGILPVASLSSLPAGQAGQYGYDAANDRIFHMATPSAKQAKTLPWAPQFASATGGSFTGAQITVCSVSVTTDGSTDLEIIATWEGYSAFVAACNALFSVAIDGTAVKRARMQNTATDSSVHGGGTLWHVTRSGTDRPSAGSHTVALTYSDNQGSVLHPSGPSNSEIYVRAVPL